MPDHETPNTTALWAITANGLRLARKLADSLENTHIYCSDSLANDDACHTAFDGLSGMVADNFHHYSRHIFFMSTGITVRVIAAHLSKKTTDPAVVVVDDTGTHAVSLLSGHIGGANRLAQAVAGAIGARPVITTATDANNLPAIDVWATDKGLAIENPQAIRHVSMAFLKKNTIALHDPYRYMDQKLPGVYRDKMSAATTAGDTVGIYIDDAIRALPEGVLVLRPPTLKAGIGCNRGTGMPEIRELLYNVLEGNQLSRASLAGLASIDIKSDEEGLLALSRELGLPIEFFSKTDLNHAAGIQSTSAAAQKHIGVKSVCEAAAILAARKGPLIVLKNKTANATVAVARINFTWSA